MRLSRIVQREQFLAVLLGKVYSQFGLHELQSCRKLLHAQIVGSLDEPGHSTCLYVIPISQNVIFAQLIPAGELRTGNECGIPFLKKIQNLHAALDSIVVSQRKHPYSGFPYFSEKLGRAVRAVRDRAVHVKIYLLQSVHHPSLFFRVRIFCPSLNSYETSSMSFFVMKMPSPPMDLSEASACTSGSALASGS